MRWSGRWRRRGAICFVGLLALAIPSLALAQRGDRGERGGGRASKPPPDGGLERAREAEERRRARRESPGARAERRRSRGRYRARGREGALEVARQELPELVETPAWEPLKLRRGQRVARYFGEFGAQVVDRDDGERFAVDSTLPLRSDVGGGPKRLVDLALEQRGGALVARNPLVSTRIPERPMDGVELGDDGFAVGLESPSSSEAELVKGRAFAANALTDTDLVVLPTPRGAQISLQVRSADAPEQATLPIRLPQGASLRLVEDEPAAQREDPRAGEGPPEGSAEVVRGEEVLARIQPPAAWDADGQPLEGVGYEVDGSKLVVRFPHRSTDVLYPLAVDPQVDRFRINATGQPIGNGSYVIGNGAEAAAWNYNRFGYGAENFGVYPGIAGYTYEHNNVLALSSAGYRGYANNSLIQWYWQAPRQSWIFRADYVNVDFIPTYQPYPLAMCVLEGVFSATRGTWESGNIYEPTNQSGGSRYFGQSPWVGGPWPGGSCSPQANNSKSHLLTSVSPGNIAAYRLLAYGDGARTNGSYTEMDGAAIHLDDAQAPSITSASSSPGGWVRSATITTTVAARDAAPGTPAGRGGLGMFVSVLSPPTEGGGAQINRFAACQIRLSRCPEAQTFSYSYSTESDLNPDAAGVQRVREGANPVTGTAYDSTGKPTAFTAGTLRVDRSAPSAGLEGIESGQLLRDRDYALTATATDALSGARKIQIKLDGTVKAQRTDCPPTSAPCRLDWTLDGSDPALTEGTHTIEVAAKDQVDNDAPVVKRTFRVERTGPAVDVLGTLRPGEEGAYFEWVDDGEVGLALDADDAGTGVVRAELRIDGDLIEALDQECAAGGCELSHDFLTDTRDIDAETQGAQPLAEGQHTVRALAYDAAGNMGKQEWTIRVERGAPELAIGGDLADADGETLQADRTYTMTADATDNQGPVGQGGVQAIEFAVDGDAVRTVEQPCMGGGCSLSSSFELSPDEEATGDHVIDVTAIDFAGNRTTRSVTVTIAEDEPAQCPSPPVPAPDPTLVALPPNQALTLLRTHMPEAVEPSSSVVFDTFTVRPELVSLGLDLFGAANTLPDVSVDKTAADGATLSVAGNDVPVCATPTAVGDKASQPIDPINGSSTLFANSRRSTDTLVRPSAVGVQTLTQLRDPTAPSELAWDMALQPGQELEKLPDGSVAVVVPAPEYAVAPTTGDDLPAPPTLSERIDAISDAGLQLSEANGWMERAEAATPDEVVALIPAPFAVDALDREVATSLSVSGSRVTMSVPRTVASAYPIVAGRQLMSTEAVAEGQALEATTATPEHTSEQPEESQPPEPSEAPPPGGPEPIDPDADQKLEELDHASAYQDEDDAGEADDEFVGDPSAARASDPTLPLRGAALGRLTKIRVGLTESHPAVFKSLEIESPRRAGDSEPTRIRPGFHRPFVPWNFVGLKDKIATRADRPVGTGDPRQDQTNRRFNDRNRLARAIVARWENWLREYRAASPSRPVDLVITQDSTTPAKAPMPDTYAKRVRAFLGRYRKQFRFDNLMPWNEPNFDKRQRYPTRNDPQRSFNGLFKQPRRAAYIWIKGGRICADLCYDKGSAVAGDFAGYAKPPRTFKYRPRGARKTQRTSYEEIYARTIRAATREAKRPRVWAFHAYGDTRAYVANGAKRRFSAPIGRRYHGAFSKSSYNYTFRPSGGTPQERGAAIWLTEVGAPYSLRCKALTGKQRGRLCGGVPNVSPDDVNQLFGMAWQRASLAFLFRKIARDYPRVNRVYYYGLHNVTSREGADGRCGSTASCPPNDWGLIGADHDATFANDPATDRRRAREPAVSTSAHPRRAFCVLRDQSRMQDYPHPKRYNNPGRRFGACPANPATGPKP